jgi:hypothetical protein
MQRSQGCGHRYFARPVPVHMWQGRAQSRCTCGKGEPSPGADVARASPVPAQMWQGRAQSRCTCGKGEPSPGADVEGLQTLVFAWPVDGVQPSRMCIACANGAGGEALQLVISCSGFARCSAIAYAIVQPSRAWKRERRRNVQDRYVHTHARQKLTHARTQAQHRAHVNTGAREHAHARTDR